MNDFRMPYSEIKALYRQAQARLDAGKSTIAPRYQVKEWIVEQKLAIIARQSPQPHVFLIIACGYEGIDKILGLFTRGGAVERMRRLRIKPHDEWTRPDQYCVQYVDGSGAECVCGQLGVSPKEKWWY